MAAAVVRISLLFVLLCFACTKSADSARQENGATPWVVATPQPPTTATLEQGVLARPSAPPQPQVAEDRDGDEPHIVVLGSSPDNRFHYWVSYPMQNPVTNGQILVQNPAGEVYPAFLDDGLVLPAVQDLRFGPDGLIGFTSQHFNYGSLVFVGRTDGTGRIRDLHRVGGHLYHPERPTGIDEFDAQGRLIAGSFVLDTATDPRFVNTADSLPDIAETALAPSIADYRSDFEGAWHLGETLAPTPACGARTLYRSVPDGWQRVVDARIELDTVVAVHTTEAFGIGGIDTVGTAREVLLATACPGEYEGQRLHWGRDSIDYGDNGPSLVGELLPVLVEKLTVREVLDVELAGPIDCCGAVSELLVTVRHLDDSVGSIAIVRSNLPDEPLIYAALLDNTDVGWEPAASVIGGEARAGTFWTGSEVLSVHPTNGGNDVVGERWDPVTNQAQSLAASGLSWRSNPAMAWTGSEVLVVGGSSGPALNQIGAAYNPATDSWRDIADPPGDVDAWENVLGGPAVWSGTEMIVASRGLAFDPSSDTWRVLSDSPLSPRARATTVWAGRQLVVWGGCFSRVGQCDEANVGLLNTGAIYDVEADTWTELPTSPLAPAVHIAGVWTGSEVMLVVTDRGEAAGAVAAAFDPVAMTWRTLAPMPLTERRFAAAVWSAGRLVVWGGQDGFGGEGMTDGAVYDPVLDSWSRLPQPSGSGRSFHSMIAIGDQVYVSASWDADVPQVLELND